MPKTAVNANRSRVLTQAVLSAAQLLELTGVQLGRILGVSQPTVARMSAGNREINENGADWQLGTLFVRLYRSLDALVGGEDSKAIQWLKANNTHLNSVPLERIQSIEGLVEVLHYVDAMRGRI